MTAIAVDVIEARAMMDMEDGKFSVSMRLANGAELTFASTPDAETMEALMAAMTQPAEGKVDGPDDAS